MRISDWSSDVCSSDLVEAALLPDAVRVGAIDVHVVDQPHGSITSAGLRFEAGGKSVGYSTDFNGLTAEMTDLFKGVDVWIVDALRRQPHPTHPHLQQALEDRKSTRLHSSH